MAGAKGLLASAWSVNDDTGPRLMTAYFSHLQEGKGKSAAYRAAQREYLTQGDPLTMHPYFWAGFVPSGDMQPLKLSDRSIYLYVFIGIAILVLIVFIFRAAVACNHLQANQKPCLSLKHQLKCKKIYNAYLLKEKIVFFELFH